MEPPRALGVLEGGGESGTARRRMEQFDAAAGHTVHVDQLRVGDDFLEAVVSRNPGPAERGLDPGQEPQGGVEHLIVVGPAVIPGPAARYVVVAGLEPPVVDGAGPGSVDEPRHPGQRDPRDWFL